MRPTLAALLLLTPLTLGACDDGDTRSESSSASASPSVSAPRSPTTTEPTEPAKDVCKVVRAADVGGVLGVEVVRAVADGGCRYANPERPDAASLGVSQGELRALGGLDGAKAGIRSVVKGPVEELPEVGDGALVVVGSAFGADTLTAGGAVALGTSLVQVTVIPAPGTTEEDLRAMTVQLLTLIAEKAAP